MSEWAFVFQMDWTGWLQLRERERERNVFKDEFLDMYGMNEGPFV